MTSMFTDGDGSESTETDSTDTEMTDIQPTTTTTTTPPPSTDYRSLVRRVEGVDPQILSRVESYARAFTNNLKSYVAATPEVRGTPLPDKAKDKKRKALAEVHQKLVKVKQEREVRGLHFGILPPPTPVPKPLPGKSKAKPKKKTAPKKVPMTAVKKKSVEVVKGDEDIARPFGHQKGGFNRNESGVRAIKPSVQIGVQTRQYLTQVSELFFAQVSTMEVEGMLVNDRLLVSANETSTATKMAQLRLGDLLAEAAKYPSAEVEVVADAHTTRRYRIGVMGEALKLVPEGEEPTEAQLKGVEVLAEAQAGFHVDYEAREMLESFVEALKTQVREVTQVRGPYTIEEAADKINDVEFKHTVIAVKALQGGKSHAEQHLALAYVKSNSSAPASIAGTKSPCAVCWLTLALVHQAGRNLDFNNTPGGLWDSTVYRGLSAVATELKISDATQIWTSFVQAYQTLLNEDTFVQYLTALKEGTGLTVTIPESGGGLKAMGYTQDISGLHREFIGERPQSPLGSSYPDPQLSPPQFYGTPPHTSVDDESDSEKEKDTED